MFDCLCIQVDRFQMTIDAACQLDNVDVPVIMTKCIEEIERRGLTTEGLYRCALVALCLRF